MQDLQHLRPDHDEFLVARLAADDLVGREAGAANALTTECPACAQLLADLRAIASATATLPATRRPRDFRLSQADAARLRPAGWRRFVARFGAPELSFTRPLAMGLTTLGIAGLLLASLPAGFGLGAGASPEAAGGAYSAAAPDASGIRNLASSPAIVMAPSVPPAAAESSPASGDASGATKSSGAPDRATQSESPAPAEGLTPGPAAIAPLSEAGGGPSPLVVLSVVLLVTGLGLGGLRRVARRLA